MFRRLERFEIALFERLRRPRLVGRIERGSFWLLLSASALFLLSFVPGTLGSISGSLDTLALLALAVFLLILLYRWVFGRLLWTVRNRLIMTCLLMGLAPVVLFATLAGIAAYIFSGQFATSVAVAALDESLGKVRDRGMAFAAPIEHEIELNPSAQSVVVPEFAQASTPLSEQQGFALAVWHDGTPLQIRIDHTRGEAANTFLEKSLNTSLAQEPAPSWLRLGFNGVVQDHQKLYLRSVTGDTSQGHTLMVIASLPLGKASLDAIAAGLGSLKVMPGFSLDTDENDAGVLAAHAHAPASGRTQDVTDFASVQGGRLVDPAHFFDTRVFFTAPLHFTDWQTGAEVPALIGVISRPTLLYQRLFANSVRIGVLVRDTLIVIAIVFSLVEIVAFLMALRLSRTITRSIKELYGATVQIDSGNLTHRIQVERHDQLAALSTSFNTMAGSLQHLVGQQREKERIQNELEIAQEVQNNLFPHAPILLPGFELHGVCKPARTVSGDYYDFILGGEGQLCLALGDISGKGISAALLMASLHSAVRAYRFAGAALGDEPSIAERVEAFPPTTFASPGKLLALLNKHLYTSTQPEKYATLFVACYDNRTRRLTYSNGGQLPPLVLRGDGSVTRLDCGGSVVGLLDGMAYEEATVSLEQGDLLIAYSDGVTEPENDFGEFGEDRLLAVIRENRHLPLATISNQAMRSLRSWIGVGEQPDDITLVLARQL